MYCMIYMYMYDTSTDVSAYMYFLFIYLIKLEAIFDYGNIHWWFTFCFLIGYCFLCPVTRTLYIISASWHSIVTKSYWECMTQNEGLARTQCVFILIGIDIWWGSASGYCQHLVIDIWLFTFLYLWQPY